MMPVCSGYEFLNLLKSYPKFKNIPVIITSAAANAQETAQLHGVELVRKPLDAEELLKKLQKVIV
jgi:CheY-like chemotaxis protein